MNAVLAAGFLTLLAIANYWIGRSVLFPPFIFCCMWVADLLLYLMNLVNVEPVHGETLAVICTGAFVFTIGGALASVVPRAVVDTRVVLLPSPASSAGPRSNTFRYFLLIALALGVCFLFLHVLAEVAQSSSTAGFFLERARQTQLDAQNEGQRQAAIYTYILIWSICAATLFRIESRDKLSRAMLAIAITACILDTGRAGLLLVISAALCVYLVQTSQISFTRAVRAMRWPVLAFIVLWIGLVFTNKNTVGYGGIGDVIRQFLVGYLVGPMLTLDFFLRHLGDFAGTPNHTFEFFFKTAGSLHIVPYDARPQYTPYILVPFPSNVYTVFRFYINDFGMTGAFLVMGVIGFLHTLLYRKARSGSAFGLYLFALSIYSVIMVIFDDQYSTFGFFLNALLFGLFYVTFRDGLIFRYLRPTTSQSC